MTIEPMRDLEAKALRVVEIRFGGPIRAEDFVDLPGVRSIDIDGDLLRASVIGSVDALVKTASRYTVESISGHEADLEDVFLAYYSEASDAAP